MLSVTTLTRHYVIMSAMASEITSLTIVYSIVYSGADQRKYQSSAPLAFVREIHSGVQRASNAEMFPFDEVIMLSLVNLLLLIIKFRSFVRDNHAGSI